MRVACAFAFVVALFAASSGADAAIAVRIDKSAQRMTVVVDGESQHTFRVSTGRRGYGTPAGTYQPQRLARKWFSSRYHGSPMPHSIFFHRGYAIHGSYITSRLGSPASHGCIRLHPGDAATLFALVQKRGLGNTRITVTGSSPAPKAVSPAKTQKHKHAKSPAKWDKKTESPAFDHARWRDANLN